MRLEINIGVDKARDSYKREKGCEATTYQSFLRYHISQRTFINYESVKLELDI